MNGTFLGYQLNTFRQHLFRLWQARPFGLPRGVAPAASGIPSAEVQLSASHFSASITRHHHRCRLLKYCLAAAGWHSGSWPLRRACAAAATTRCQPGQMLVFAIQPTAPK
ncbi:MAG: hypothetical protein V4717_21945 [Bacteroidota bacterium]